jgi:ribosomal protein S18 acetylase RimI-like enzyme
MGTISITEATERGVKALSRKLLKLLEDKNSQVYRENVAKFGIPEEYVKKAFSEETLLESATFGKSTFYLALENKCKILGFAQIIQRDTGTAELDRIVVFPEFTRKGIGTMLLTRVLEDQKRKGTEFIIVNTGRDETHARSFYEKNGFKRLKEAAIDAPWGKMILVTYQRQLRP